MTSEGDRREPSERRAGGAKRRHASNGNRPKGDSRKSRTATERSRETSEDRPKARRDQRERLDKTSGELCEPRVKENPQKIRTDGGTTDEIPLNIAGHEDEKRRRENGSETPDGDILSEFDVSDPREDTDDEVEPVELLVQLAEEGEIDPWDIDVVTVTDKFLDRLDNADLRTGGRALFYASVLLRMKSDVMWADEEPEAEPELEPWELPPGEEPPDGFEADPFEKLDREMDRRIERKRARGMPETLDELVRDLRERERDTWWKESRTYDTSESPSNYSRGTQTLDYHTGDDFRMEDEPTAEEVTGRTHDEHMEDIINDVFRKLQTQYDRGREEVLFAEIRTAGGSVVNTFLGLLFLSHRGRVKLQQDELFGDLWIRDPAATAVSEPASADD